MVLHNFSLNQQTNLNSRYQAGQVKATFTFPTCAPSVMHARCAAMIPYCAISWGKTCINDLQFSQIVPHLHLANGGTRTLLNNATVPYSPAFANAAINARFSSVTNLLTAFKTLRKMKPTPRSKVRNKSIHPTCAWSVASQQFDTQHRGKLL